MARSDRSDDSEIDALSISQLAERASVPARRIRFYVQQSILPPPRGQGRAAHYTSEHLTRLREITTLREMNLGLEEIRERLGPVEPRSSGGQRTEKPESWGKWTVADGIEILVREDVDPDVRERVGVLVSVARQLLGTAEENTTRE